MECINRIGVPVTPPTCKDGIYTGHVFKCDTRKIFLYEALMPDKSYTWIQGEAPEYYDGVKLW